MDGRPLVNDEFWGDLIDKSSGRNSQFKERDQLLLGLACLAGFREIELTLCTIDLFIAPNGELNELIVMPESIAYDNCERPIPLAHPDLQNLFQTYIKWLLNNGLNTHPGESYLGLNPNAQLFVDDSYRPYTVQKRGNDTLSPNALNKHLDSLIKRASLWDCGIRRKSFVRTFIINGYRAGMSTSDLIVISGLGHDTIEKTLTMDYEQYSPIAEWFVKRREQKVKHLESMKKRRRFML